MKTGRPHGRSRRRRICLIGHTHTAKFGGQSRDQRRVVMPAKRAGVMNFLRFNRALNMIF